MTSYGTCVLGELQQKSRNLHRACRPLRWDVLVRQNLCSAAYHTTRSLHDLDHVSVKDGQSYPLEYSYRTLGQDSSP